MHGLRARVDKLSDDVKRPSQPWFDFAYRNHMVPRTAVTPSWYERPQMTNMFDVGLSRGLGGYKLVIIDSPMHLGVGNSNGEDDFQHHGNDEDNHHDVFYLPSDLLQFRRMFYIFCLFCIVFVCFVC